VRQWAEKCLCCRSLTESDVTVLRALEAGGEIVSMRCSVRVAETEKGANSERCSIRVAETEGGATSSYRENGC
jgi:hypothetical protein